MTLQRRVLIWLLAITSILWLSTLVIGAVYTRQEVNELFDTEQLRTAQQVLASISVTVDESGIDAGAADRGAGAGSTGSFELPPVIDAGAADPDDMAIAVWDQGGQLLSRADEGASIPFSNRPSGFLRQMMGGSEWNVYYLNAPTADRIVAVAFRVAERTELLRDLILSYVLPLLLSLPLLLAAITLAVRRAFQPLRTLANAMEARTADNLKPVALEETPGDIKPLAVAMNRLFDRIRAALDHERRLTADASHELRTPIAALQAQWDALGLANDPETRDAAVRRMGEGLDRLARLVSQLLSLSSMESDSAHRAHRPVSWQRVVENAVSDVLPLMERRLGDISVEWPAEGSSAAFPLQGDEALLTMMIRNLLDNSLRYGLRDVEVTIKVGRDNIRIVDTGPGLSPEVIGRLGSRFYRPAGRGGQGSGIGISIVMRIAELHGLTISFDTPAGRPANPAGRPANPVDRPAVAVGSDDATRALESAQGAPTSGPGLIVSIDRVGTRETT